MATIKTVSINSELYGDIVYSPDDGGYYVDLFGRDGKDKGCLPRGQSVYKTREAAERAIKRLRQKS